MTTATVAVTVAAAVVAGRIGTSASLHCPALVWSALPCMRSQPSARASEGKEGRS